MSDEIKRRFNHPCKNTCSGWKQGHDLGLDHGIIRGRNESIDEIKVLNAFAESMAKTLQFYAKQDKGPYHSPAGGNYMSIENDGGKRAREALVPWYAFKERNKS